MASAPQKRGAPPRQDGDTETLMQPVELSPADRDHIASLCEALIAEENLLATYAEKVKARKAEVAAFLSEKFGDGQPCAIRANGYEASRVIATTRGWDNEVLTSLLAASNIDRLSEMPPFIKAALSISSAALAKLPRAERELYEAAATERQSSRITVKSLA